MTTILAAFLLIAAQVQPQPAPLPDIETFKASVWQIVNTIGVVGDSIQSKSTPLDEGELLQYAYMEKETVTKLDGSGRAKGTETNLYQVTRGPENWQFYRKLISTNGAPLSEAELAKQDVQQQEREHKQREEIDRHMKAALKSAAKQKNRNPQPVSTLTLEQQAKMRDDNLFFYFSSIYDIQIVRREVIDGHSTVLLTFSPKAKAKTGDDFLKMLQHVTIRGWVTERDHKVIRAEADVIDTISFGLGLLAKLQKGSQLRFERRPINDGTWAPIKMEATMNARILLLKGINERQSSEYSDFKKYTVETTMKVIESESPQID